MIKNIRATVTFPISGEVLNVDFSPPPGVTAVVGPNGSGKTFTGSECTRWLLFGKAALRGAAGDYATLTGKGEFTIAGADYTIERGPKKEQITDADGKILAVGAKAVTAKVEEIFGYGLAVFDICNASVQKDADSFGKLLPAARKRLLDRVCGLSSNEAVEKECRDKARDYRTRAEALAGAMRAPEVPVAPVPVLPSSTSLQSELVRARHIFRNAEMVRGLVKQVFVPDEPTVERPSGATLSALEAHQDLYAVNSAERRRLQSILSECTPVVGLSLTEEQLVAAEQRNIAAAEIERRGEKPTLPLETLDSLSDLWAAHEAATRQSDEHVECPECQHEFRVGGEIPPAPDCSKRTIAAERDAHARWKLPQPPMPDGLDLTPQQIIFGRKGLADKLRYERAGTMLNDLPILADKNEELHNARAAEATWAAHEAVIMSGARQLAINAEAEAELAAMIGVPAQEDLDRLNEQVSIMRTYEEALRRHAEAQAEFIRVGEEIAAANLMAAAFTEGAKALSEARTELKGVLTPLLSIVASDLLFQMSNGKLKSIVVDEDMEITVDGRRIETLSGAGVTVANIALRIGLGQVLVKNTFPVFLGDEMDSDADASRREATLAAMRSLRSRLQQIILITHREVEDVDMVLDLGA